MNALVAYTSQTGFTKRYATWIAEELDCQAATLKQADRLDLASYDVVVVGGWFHAASMTSKTWLDQQRAAHPELRFVAFAVGATPHDWTDVVDEGMARAFPSPDYDNVPHFYLTGGFDYTRLSFLNKLAMRMFFKMQEKEAESDPRTAEMLATMREGFDATDRTAIAPIINCVHTMTD